MKNSNKTILFTLIFVLTCVIIVTIIQLTNQSSLPKCSYLDPISIDLLALIAALFLFVEGIYRIKEHIHAPLKNQITRSIRVAFGASILTLHIIQFFFKG